MIKEGSKVKVLYTGRLEEDGTVFDSSDLHGGEPLEFEVGSGQVIPGFDFFVREMEVGEKRTVHLPMEIAYGAANPNLIVSIAAEDFPGWEDVPMGKRILLQSGEESMPATLVKEVEGMLFFDLNHELAGKDLVFDIEVLSVE